MSARHYIKGLKRKAHAAGLGRGANSAGAVAELVEKHDAAERDRARGLQRIKAERRLSELDRYAAQDQRRARGGK